MTFRTWGALIGALAIFAAAFGAHGLEKVAVAGGVRHWAIGAAIQLATAPAILIAGAWADQGSASRLSPILLTIGVALFSGSLYAMALGAPRVLGAVTPLGGLCLAAGWFALAWR